MENKWQFFQSSSVQKHFKPAIDNMSVLVSLGKKEIIKRNKCGLWYGGEAVLDAETGVAVGAVH